MALPAAPYESDPAKWPKLDWYDRRTGQPIDVITLADRDDPERMSMVTPRNVGLLQELDIRWVVFHALPDYDIHTAIAMADSLVADTVATIAAMDLVMGDVDR